MKLVLRLNLNFYGISISSAQYLSYMDQGIGTNPYSKKYFSNKSFFNMSAFCKRLIDDVICELLKMRIVPAKPVEFKGF